MKRGGGGGPEKVGRLVEEWLEEHGVEDQVRRMGAVEAWPEVVGEHVAEVTRARSVEGAILFVEVRSSPWLMELNMMKGELLRRVNERLPEAPLDRIVFVQAETG